MTENKKELKMNLQCEVEVVKFRDKEFYVEISGVNNAMSGRGYVTVLDNGELQFLTANCEEKYRLATRLFGSDLKAIIDGCEATIEGFHFKTGERIKKDTMLSIIKKRIKKKPVNYDIYEADDEIKNIINSAVLRELRDEGLVSWDSVFGNRPDPGHVHAGHSIEFLEGGEK